MNSKLVHFEKYAVAPSPSRNYYGIKVLDDEVNKNECSKYSLSHKANLK